MLLLKIVGLRVGNLEIFYGKMCNNGVATNIFEGKFHFKVAVYEIQLNATNL